MEKELNEKPPFRFLIAPIIAMVCIYLTLFLSQQIREWLNLEIYLGIPIIIRYSVGVLLIIIGLVFFLLGFIRLKPAAALGYAERLRDKGVYGLTRNPMYFGLNSIFWGIALFLDNLSLFIAALIWSLLIYLIVIFWEEKQLFGKFGEEYLEYKKRVPRFIPIKLKRQK